MFSTTKCGPPLLSGLESPIKTGQVLHNIYSKETIIELMVVKEVYNIEGVGSTLLDRCGFEVAKVLNFIKWNRNRLPHFLHYNWVENLR